MEITSNRITATPRSKYHKYGIASSNNISNSSGSANIDVSNFVKKTGETEQTIEGNVLATGDLVAYSTGQSVENYPIASSTALGTIKVGENLTITDDGTLNAEAGGVSNWNELQGKPTLLTDTNIQKWETNSHTHTNKAILDTITADSIHTHSNKSYLDSINQNLSKTSDVNFGSVKATGDIIAYSTGISAENYPIASSTALGCIKVGNNLSITSDGTLSAQAGGVTSWNELKDKPTTLAGYGITDAAKASDLTSHTGNTTVHITATERTNWSSAYSNSHTHSNKTTLDGISSTNVSNWNTAYTNNHTHSNKSVIDGITSTNITNWNDANSKKHTHSNKSYLDVINQNLATTSDVTFAGVKSTGDVVAYSTGQSTEKYPIASATALGTIKVGSGLSITSDGTLSATGAGSVGSINVSGSGNVVTEVSLTKGTISFTKDLTALTTANYTTTLDGRYLKLSGNATTATTLQTARSISITDGTNTSTGVSFNGSANVSLNLPSTIKASLSGNATTATTLQTARTINGTSFNGSANITTANWGTARNIYIADSDSTNTGSAVSVNGSANATLKLPATIKAALSGNATTATTLQTARTINGTSFNGSANITTANWGTARNIYIADSTSTNTGAAVSVNGSANATLKLPSTIKASLTGNASTATTLATSRTLWGQYFNGSGNVSGNMTGVGSITMSGQLNAASLSGMWIYGKTNGVINLDSTNSSTSTYFPLYRWKSYTGRVFNLGALQATDTGHTFGFYMFNKDRTANGTDAEFYMNSSGDMRGTGNLAMNGDVIAYSTGTSSAPFKYWYPSVDSKGNLSWTNSTSTTTPSSVNIKGAKGDKGDTGKSVGKVSAYSTSSASGGSSVYRVYDTSNALLGSFTVYNGAKGEKGDTGATGLKGDTGDASNGGLINGLTWLRNPSSGSICYITGNAVSGYTSSSPNLWINWSPTAVAKGTSCSYSYRTLKVGGKSEGTAILSVNDGNNGSFTGNYGGSSDIRLKENIVNVDNVLSALENIDIFKFNYKNDEDKQIHFGVSAQKVNEYYPELITYADNDEYGKTMVLKYIEFNTLMAVGGVKELHALVKSQQAKIDELEQRLAIIESKNNEL